MHFDLVSLVNNGEFYVLDVEGDGERDQHPVEISLLRYSNGRPVEEFHWLVNPERPISAYVTGLHGIDDTTVCKAPVFSSIRAEVASHLDGAVIAAHNIRDDMRMLAAVMPEAPLLPSKMVDTIRLSRNVMREIGKHNLDAISQVLQIEVPRIRPYPVHTDFPFLGSERHSTGADCFLAGEALVVMSARIDLNPKQLRHISQSVLYQMNPRQQQALSDAFEAEAAPPVTSLGVFRV